MAGFGQKRSSSKKQKKTQRQLHLTPEQLRANAINQHISGNLQAAERSYQAFLHTGINDPDVLSNYALICQESGRIEKALTLYEKSIKFFPDHSLTNANLGYLYLSIGEVEKAELVTRKAIALSPELATSYSTLGLILKAKGNLKEAETTILRAIELKDDFADAYLNLGLILKSCGRLKEALIATKKALNINPDSADANLNLGTILQEQGALKEAEQMTRKAIELQEDIPDANMNLGTILKEQGNLQGALIHIRREIAISPNKQAPYLLLNSLLKECNLSSLDQIEIRNVLQVLLRRRDISHMDLFRAINELINIDNLFAIAKSETSILRTDYFLSLIKDKEIVSALKLMTFNSSIWETILTKARKDICIAISSGQMKPSKILTEFTISLAEQCFLNEYIFNIEEKELKALAQIKDECSSKIIDEFKIAILACYTPLYSLAKELPNLLNYQSNNQTYNDLLNLQYKEPMQEEEIAASIIKFGKISSSVSEKVKLQYEENPYPRWRFTSHLNENKLTFAAAINNEIKPNRINYIQSKGIYKILIAGCGTGQQIFDADRYENAEITAIDLSRSSIAYAQRKVYEYGIKKINFLQMDLLELPNLNQKFDLIECCGVLHHMKVPEEGLSALLKVLNKNGFLKLGLYSELARKDVVEAREIIKAKNINPSQEGIRQFRKEISSGKFPDVQQLYQWTDFYTTSMCRDLCFHVQEHRYSINSIKKLLYDFQLNFLGFMLDQFEKDKYSNIFEKDKNQLDLNNWNEFEKINPDTFRSMYQFWVNRNV